MSLISLVGLPASGKSTIARRLAADLSWKVLDSDREIERDAGCSIAELFERAGESRFRDLEEETIARLMTESDAVVATGGGTVIRAANRIALRARSHVVYLDSPPQELIRRLHGGKRRPLFDGVDVKAKLDELFRERDALYREVAHVVVPTLGLSSARIASLIGEQLLSVRMNASAARQSESNASPAR